MPQPSIASVGDANIRPHQTPFPSPRDWRDIFLYELMIDRFDDNVDHPAFDPTSHRPHPHRDEREGKRFQGGNLKGITRRLEYISGLGANAIWITSPLQNRADDPHSYHGYGPQDFLSIDSRFGSLEDLRALTREAHARNMYVILDIVIDHAGDVFAYANDERAVYSRARRYDFGRWRDTIGVSPVELKHPDAFKRMGRMRDPGRARGGEAFDGDFHNLKSLDLDKSSVLSAITRIYKYWIAAADVDGFRIDAFRHFRPEAGAAFCHAIREFTASIGKKNFLLIGEVAGPRNLMLKYIGSNAHARGARESYPMLDACLDFELYRWLPEVIRGEKPHSHLREHYEVHAKHFRDYAESGKYWVTFLENHDQAGKRTRRFLHGIDNTAARDATAILGAGYLLTSMGIPCWYYGSEQGFNGGGRGDHFVREAMFGGTWGGLGTAGVHFFDPNHKIYRAIAQLAAIRHEMPALRYGRQYVRASGDAHTLAYSRILDETEILIVMNTSPGARNDSIYVDERMLPPGTVLHDLLDPARRVRVEPVSKADHRAVVRVLLPARTMSILSRTPRS